MTTPVDESTNVGYCVAADVYCSFSEYYGDGTVYGWRHLYIGDEVVRGAGKTKRELIAAGALQEEAICPAVPADVVVLALDPVPEAPITEEPPAPEAPAPEAPAPEAPAPEAPAPEAPNCACDPCLCSQKTPEKVTVKFKDVSVTLNTKLAKDVTISVTEAGELIFTL